MGARMHPFKPTSARRGGARRLSGRVALRRAGDGARPPAARTCPGRSGKSLLLFRGVLGRRLCKWRSPVSCRRHLLGAPCPRPALSPRVGLAASSLTSGVAGAVARYYGPSCSSQRGGGLLTPEPVGQALAGARVSRCDRVTTGCQAGSLMQYVGVSSDGTSGVPG